jgi:hypothetical protein
MSLPPLYTCSVCNAEINPSSANSLRIATVWLKSSGKTVHEIVEELYIYRHNFCSEKPDAQQDSLF